MPRLSDPTRVQFWTERLERFRHSGLPASQFCSQESINPSSFYQWKKKLAAPKDQSLAPRPVAPKFVSVQVKQPLQDQVAMLRLPAGLALELPSSLQRDAITELIAACIQAASASASCFLFK